MYVYVSVPTWVYVHHMYAGVHKEQKRTALTGDCELPDRSAGIQTWVPYKNNT